MMEMAEPNTCFRGCCWSEGIRLHFPPSSYSLNSIISRGSESTVFEATLLGRRVVAKKPVLSTSDDLDKFHRQLQLLCKMDHPSLAKLVAANSMPPNYLLFFDLYEMGSVAHKLHVEEWSPSVKEALVIAYGLANALKYMHELGIVHRDVKPGNILLDSKLHPYLADFGLASDKKDLKQVSLENWKSSGKPTGGFHKKNMVGTLIYMAPEILRRNIHTEKSDVYSFAISINELLAGVVPYTDLRAEAQAHTVLEMSYTEMQLTTAIVSGLRPVLASSVSGLPPRLMALIQRCWDSNSVFRPSFNDITKELDEILMDATKVDVGKSSMMLLSSISRQCPNGIDNPHNFEENLNWFNQGELASKQVDEGMKSEKLWPSFLDEPLHYRPTLSWGSFSTFGRREKMEDTHFLLPQMCNDLDIHLFGIFDGHRGVAAAEFSVRALPGFLKRSAHNSSPSEALCKAFVNTDIAFRKEMALRCNSKRVSQKDMYAGCTALVALIVRNKLFVANAGDCRAVLCRAGLPIPLSKEHIASCGKERTRVTNEGMKVTWQVDTWRVGTAALQVTRSIGDDDLKPAVTAEPEITETCLSGLDEFLVMASDGLWDVLSNERVISIIRDTVKEPTMCSKRLATEAVECGSGDNITVIVVFLAAVSTAERVY